MNFLPEVVLIEIFDYCGKNLKNLTLTCKRFNEIISYSRRLMKHLRIRAYGILESEWICTRKYSKMRLSNLLALPIIFQDIKNDLTELDLCKNQINAMDLKYIFLSTPKLTWLRLWLKECQIVDNCFEEPMPRLNLDYLDFRSTATVINILMNCQTRICETGYLNFRNDQREIEAFKMFLKRQNHLEELNISHFYSWHRMFDDDTLNEVEFRLKKLSIKEFNIYNVQNFHKFLNNHRSSLKFMEVWRASGFYVSEMIRNVKDFQNLKKLQLHQVGQIVFELMPYIEELKLGGMIRNKDSKNWSKNFPNVKDLCLDDVGNYQEFKNFEKLESLKIQSIERLRVLRIPSTVKKLNLCNLKLKLLRPVDYQNHQIENFSIDFIWNGDWMIDFVKSLNRKLKILKVERVVFSKYRRFFQMFENEADYKELAENFYYRDWIATYYDDVQ